MVDVVWTLLRERRVDLFYTITMDKRLWALRLPRNADQHLLLPLIILVSLQLSAAPIRKVWQAAATSPLTAENNVRDDKTGGQA